MLAESLTRSWAMSAGSLQPALQPFDQPHQFLGSPMPGAAPEIRPPQPDGDVPGAQAVADAIRRQLEQLIAGTVPQVVVDELEAVEIDEQQRQDVGSGGPSLSPWRVAPAADGDCRGR